MDFANWAVVSYNDDTGLGRMAADARAVLGVTHQLVVPSERLTDKALDRDRDRLLRPSCPEEELRSVLSGLEGIIILEQHSWHRNLLPVARRMGVRTICVPMWEWFRGSDAEWKSVEWFACPNQMALKVVRSYGHMNSSFVPWALDLSRFPPRQVSGPARVFIHNAGLVDMEDRKGTSDVIRAFKRVRRRDVRLIVRLQKAAELPEPDERVEIRIGNLGNPAGLYAEGEAAVQPSKMEGLGFMVLEPLCCGLPVVTTDNPPMNEYVRQAELLARKRWFPRSAFPARAAGVAHARLRPPSVPDLARKMEWCADHDLSSFSRANRAFAEDWFDPSRVRAAWSRALANLP